MNNDTPKCLESRGSWRNSQSLKHTRGFSKTKTEKLRILALYRSTEIPWYGPLKMHHPWKPMSDRNYSTSTEICS